ncbi:uncharacterized protein [Centruroides vittatus]|uniref:uncharacterized protein isoform X2 n=1 Tax=Centruroides vittatus TaxID=120091 RepID=UPI003510AF87
MSTVEDKVSKQKRKRAENYLSNLINHVSPEIKENLKEMKKYPSIVKAVYLGDEKAIDLLLDAGDSINVQIADGTTPLIMAVERGHVHLIKKLLEAGADPTVLRKHGNTLLVLAAGTSWEAGITSMFSRHDININHQNLNGKTALMIATAQGHMQIVEILLYRGANLLLEDQKGATALCYAVFHQHSEIAHCLYQKMDYSFKNTFVKEVCYNYSCGPVYTMTKLCEYNLQEYLPLVQKNNLLPIVGKKLVHQLFEGLEYLHSQSILHGRLKPNNVQIGTNGNLLLSDFGLLDMWPPLCGILTYSSPNEVSVYSWRCQECVTAISTSVAKSAFTAASDIQVAGMLTYFIFTGLHPFGSNDIECQVKIGEGNPIFQYLGPELNDSVAWMISYEPTTRPTACMILNHPYFWSSQKKLDFLIAVVNQPEMDSKCWKEIEGRTEFTRFENWISQDTYSGQHFEKMSGLLRLISNCIKPYNLLSDEVRTILNNPAFYFTENFPSLVINIYKVLLRSDWKYRPSLASFFN